MLGFLPSVSQPFLPMPALRTLLTRPLRASHVLAASLGLALSLSLTLAPSPSSAIVIEPYVPFAGEQILRPEDHPSLPAGPWGGRLTTSGDWLALGALRTVGDVATDTGRVLLWERVNGLWQPRQVLAGVARDMDRQDLFGHRVAMDGKRMVVSSGDGVEHLHTYVLKGETWVFDGLLKPQAGDVTNESFGTYQGIAISGDTIAVSAHAGRVRGFDGTGWVDVFQRTGAGWVRTARLTDANPLGTEMANTSYLFGLCLGLQRDMLFVSVQDDGVPAPRIAIFKKTGATWVRQRDIIVAGAHYLLGDLTPSPAGDRLFVSLPNLLREYSLTRPYEIISERQGHGSAHVRGKSAVWGPSIHQSRPDVSLQRQLPDRTWVEQRVLEQADTGIAPVTQAHLTEHDLLISGQPFAPGGTFHIRSTTVEIPLLEFHHSGHVTEAPPALPAANRVILQAGEHLVGKEIKPLVTLHAYLPVPAQASGGQSATHGLFVSATGDTADFSLPTHRFLEPGKITDVKVDFKPLSPGPKSLVITLSRSGGNPNFLVRYEITAQAVSQGTPVQITQQPQSGLYGPFQFQGLHVKATGTRPITYRWLRNGTAVPGGTGPSLWPKDGGTYTVEVSNGHGQKAVSAPAALGFYAIQQPYVFVRPEAPARCAVALSGPGITARWQAQGPLEDGALYAGVSTPVLTVKKAGDPEGYQARVTMRTPQGGELTALTGICMVHGVLPPEIQDFDGGGTYRVGESRLPIPPLHLWEWTGLQRAPLHLQPPARRRHGRRPG